MGRNTRAVGTIHARVKGVEIGGKVVAMISPSEMVNDTALYIFLSVEPIANKGGDEGSKGQSQAKFEYIEETMGATRHNLNVVDFGGGGGKG